MCSSDLIDSVGWVIDWAQDPPTRIDGAGILNIRAANEANLKGLNFNASVENIPSLVSPDGSKAVEPPPPFYDPALFVPLPPN